MIAKTNGPKILIVEDNIRLAESMAVLLNDAGYEVCLAATSAQGISKAITELPNFILTDLELPDMIATEAIAILKKNPVTSRIPIVVLTAEGDKRWRSEALNAGAAKYLLKPISPGELIKIAVDSVDDIPAD
jgi:DNA-binding response OmpR family regulator